MINNPRENHIVFHKISSSKNSSRYREARRMDLLSVGEVSILNLNICKFVYSGREWMKHGVCFFHMFRKSSTLINFSSLLSSVLWRQALFLQFLMFIRNWNSCENCVFLLYCVEFLCCVQNFNLENVLTREREREKGRETNKKEVNTSMRSINSLCIFWNAERLWNNSTYKMTSRSYTKSYGRKVNTVSPGSIQFDKLFRENSNRPSAAKSAGIVGKWGITSFTSIRSTNINGIFHYFHIKHSILYYFIDFHNEIAIFSFF